MYTEKNLASRVEEPIEIQQPELQRIIEKLMSAVNRYDGIVCETKSRLYAIKKNNENPAPIDTLKEKPSESATDEINRLIYKLNDLNEVAEANLRHLVQIV
jgi:hypothetical protein